VTLENQRITLKWASIISILSVVALSSVAWESIINRVSAVENNLQDEKEVYTGIVEKQNGNDVALARIQTQLSSIDANIAEIKSRYFNIVR